MSEVASDKKKKDKRFIYLLSILVFAVLLFLVFWFTAMLAGDESFPETTTTESLTFTVLAEGSNSGIDEMNEAIISSQVEMDEMWKEHTAGVVLGAVAPAVDFETETVIAVFAGQKSSGGYGVEVTEVVETDWELIVYVDYTEPSEGSFTTQAITQPFQIISIPNIDEIEKVIRFR